METFQKKTKKRTVVAGSPHSSDLSINSIVSHLKIYKRDSIKNSDPNVTKIMAEIPENILKTDVS